MFIRPEKICQKYLVKRILLCFEKWHCLSDSELCEAIANKRMYEIRKRSVFSKRSGYSFANR